MAINVKHSASVIYKDNSLELLYFDGGSEFLLVTFNELTTKADGKHFWGDAYAYKTQGCSVLDTLRAD